MERIKIHLRGLVQGVGFRWNCRKKAQMLGLSGYVSNLSDGGVEIVAEGSKQALVNLTDWVKTGQHFARVDSFETQWEKYAGKFEKFEILVKQ
ncbi:acylphosphatase [Patescibacteria group bacterium]|nr:acylphosphatase [Patescibacteria group bacterium]MBU1613267.1 acylphosphatase [Patescibacteria group bacterium]